MQTESPSALLRLKVLAITYRLPTIAACAILTGGLQALVHTIRPACRSVMLSDSSINYPFAEKEEFPTYSLAFVVALPVVLVYAPCIYAFGLSTTRSAHREFFTWVLTQWVAWVFQMAFVDTTKLYAGRLRPDFLSRLRNLGIVTGGDGDGTTSVQWANGPVDLCQKEYITNKVLREGRLSFPSGHSSNAWVAMVLLSVFLFSKLRPFYHQSMIRLVASLVPLVLSTVIMASRTLDYRHHFSDVVTGAIVGVVAAFGALFFNFDYVSEVGVFVPKVPTHPLDAFCRKADAAAGVAACSAAAASSANGGDAHASVTIVADGVGADERHRTTSDDTCMGGRRATTNGSACDPLVTASSTKAAVSEGEEEEDRALRRAVSDAFITPASRRPFFGGGLFNLYKTNKRTVGAN